MAYICTRCKNMKDDFKEKNGVRIKTCIRCQLEKKKYALTDKGKEVHKKAKFKWTQSPKGKRSQIDSNKRMRIKWKNKVNARKYIWYHKKVGHIKSTDCIVCGNPKSEAHHLTYDDKKNVIWVCVKCHKILHRKE